MVAEASRVPCASCAARAPAADTEQESGDQPGGERTWSARRKDTRARGSRARGSRPRRGLSRARQRDQQGGEPGLAGGPLHVTGTRPPPALRRGHSVSKVAANTDLGDGERCSPGRPGLASCERPVALSVTHRQLRGLASREDAFLSTSRWFIDSERAANSAVAQAGANRLQHARPHGARHGLPRDPWSPFCHPVGSSPLLEAER